MLVSGMVARYSALGLAVTDRLPARNWMVDSGMVSLMVWTDADADSTTLAHAQQRSSCASSCFDTRSQWLSFPPAAGGDKGYSDMELRRFVDALIGQVSLDREQPVAEFLRHATLHRHYGDDARPCGENGCLAVDEVESLALLDHPDKISTASGSCCSQMLKRRA